MHRCLGLRDTDLGPGSSITASPINLSSNQIGGLVKYSLESGRADLSPCVLSLRPGGKVMCVLPLQMQHLFNIHDAQVSANAIRVRRTYAELHVRGGPDYYE